MVAAGVDLGREPLVHRGAEHRVDVRVLPVRVCTGPGGGDGHAEIQMSTAPRFTLVNDLGGRGSTATGCNGDAANAAVFSAL